MVESGRASEGDVLEESYKRAKADLPPLLHAMRSQGWEVQRVLLAPGERRFYSTRSPESLGRALALEGCKGE